MFFLTEALARFETWAYTLYILVRACTTRDVDDNIHVYIVSTAGNSATSHPKLLNYVKPSRDFSLRSRHVCAVIAEFQESAPISNTLGPDEGRLYTYSGRSRGDDLRNNDISLY